MTITLTDAPDAVQDSVAEDDVSNLVVHQQDIQAVANALWAGGAEAMTIQGQRVVSTTGIRCVGNSVVLHDVPYAPPYVIRAIGADRRRCSTASMTAPTSASTSRRSPPTSSAGTSTSSPLIEMPRVRRLDRAQLCPARRAAADLADDRT